MRFLRLLILLFIFSPCAARAALPADAIAVDFKLWWDVPVRAYTGVSLSHRVTYYEKENRNLTWSLDNEPVGLTVDDTGLLSWVSPSAGTYTDIVLTATRGFCNSTEYPSCSLTVSQTFTLTVGTSDFVFIDDTGTNNGGCGTIGSPCATLGYAIANKITGNDGKTFYMRSGTYVESFSAAQFASKTFTASDYMYIRSYPGESAIIDAVSGGGLELSSSGQYIVVSNLEIKNAIDAARGGNIGLSGTNQIAKDLVIHDASWSGNDNCSGVYISGSDNVSNRVVSYGNEGPSGNTNNFQNWVIYNDTTDAIKWVLNSKGWDSTHNIKIKHTNASGSKVIIHNSENIGIPITGFGINSSIRYGVFYNTGLVLALTDPSSYTTGQMLVEHNTIVGASGNADNINIGDGYGTVGPVYLRRNISYQGNGACGAGNDVRKHMQLWQYTSPLATPRAYFYDSDYNIFHNTTSNTDCWIVGSNAVSPTTLNFAAYQALTGTGIVRDPNSIVSDPAFGAVGSGDLDIQDTSPAATNCGSGEYCGAFWPEQDYGTVGLENTTLLNMDGSVDTTTSTTVSTTSSTTSTTTTTTVSPTPPQLHRGKWFRRLYERMIGK